MGVISAAVVFSVAVMLLALWIWGFLASSSY